MHTHQTKKLDLTSAMEAQGLTKRHWLFFSVIALIMLFDGMDVTIVSHIFPSLIQDWGVEVGGGIAIVVSGGFVGMGVGALIAGRLADLIGRKTVFIWAAALFSVATALGATSGDFAAFTLWRWIACLGMGSTMASANALLSELVPKRNRAALLAVAYAFVGLGTALGASLAGLILPTEGWRLLLAMAGIGPFIFVVLAAFVLPESPGHYLARGSVDRAKRSVKRIVPDLDLSEVELVLPEQPTSTSEHQTGALTKLMSKTYAPVTILLFIFGFVSLGTQLTIVQYLPILLQLPSTGLDTVQSSAIVSLYGLTSTAGGLLIGVFLAKWSRFVVFGTLLALSSLTILTVALTPAPGYTLLLIMFGIFGAIVPSVLGPSRSILAATALPTDIRATGIGATEMGGRIGSALGGGIGGVLIGTGIGLSGFLLLLLFPIALLGGALGGLNILSRKKVSDNIGAYSSNRHDKVLRSNAQQ